MECYAMIRRDELGEYIDIKTLSYSKEYCQCKGNNVDLKTPSWAAGNKQVGIEIVTITRGRLVNQRRSVLTNQKPKKEV